MTPHCPTCNYELTRTASGYVCANCNGKVYSKAELVARLPKAMKLGCFARAHWTIAGKPGIWVQAVGRDGAVEAWTGRRVLALKRDAWVEQCVAAAMEGRIP